MAKSLQEVQNENKSIIKQYSGLKKSDNKKSSFIS